MKLVINRKEWRRGPQTTEIIKNDPTSLLCNDGTKCCLGFYALQCGFKPEEIKRLGEPSEVEVDEDFPQGWDKLIKFFEGDYDCGSYRKNTDLAEDAISINDDGNITDEEREAQLKARFAEEGIEVEFNG